MNPAIIAALLALAAVGVALWTRQEAVTPGATEAPPDNQPDTSNEGGLNVFSLWPDAPALSLPGEALPEVASVPIPIDTAQQNRNVAAALAMIMKAEGTAKEGGYGALFGWPAQGRSFDPYSVADHPKVFFDYTDKAGKKLKTSAAGAMQITWTTWSDYRAGFKRWAAANGYSSAGFTPDTQRAFGIYLMHLDGALNDVKAGRLDQALPRLARRWASLPGANVNQPERALQFVQNAYTQAGGVMA